MARKPMNIKRMIFLVVMFLVITALRNYQNKNSGPADSAIEQATRNHQSDVVVEATGTVKRSLPDDREGSRHQRFILQLPSGQTVLVAHNIDLAPRVPLAEGDQLTIRGEYEYNDRGGVLHWTHHDPGGRHEDGWIKHRGKTYQ